MSKVFEHCGWSMQGHFDPCGQLEMDSRNAAGVSTIQAHTNEEGEQQLGFVLREVGETQS